MYYEEKIINGVLCCRTTPDGIWQPFTLEELSTRLEAKEKECEKLKSLLGEVRNHTAFIPWFDLSEIIDSLLTPPQTPATNEVEG